MTRARDNASVLTGGATVTVASGSTAPLTIQNNGTGNSFVVNDEATDTTNFIVDNSGNLGIGGAASGNAKLDIYGTNSRIRWENNTTTALEVSTNLAANAYLDKAVDALSHSFRLSGTEKGKFDSSGYLSKVALRAPKELWTVSATAATGTIQFDCSTQGVLYYTTNSSANFTLNFRGDSSTTLNSLMNTGDAITVNFLATNSTAYYQSTAVTVDTNATVSIKWSGGTAPSAGNASAIDIYSYTIVKTGASAFTVLCAGPVKYA